jgi:transposase
MSTKKKYDKSFKQQAIQFALSADQSLSKTAKELGLLESTLYSWVNKAKGQKTAAESTTQADVGKMHEELLKLRKDNLRLRETCEILKKATAYFANDSKQDTNS